MSFKPDFTWIVMVLVLNFSITTFCADRDQDEENRGHPMGKTGG